MPELNPEQIIALLTEYDRGSPKSELCRRAAISGATFDDLYDRFGSLVSAYEKKMAILTEHNSNLKKVTLDMVQENDLLKNLWNKKAK